MYENQYIVDLTIEGLVYASIKSCFMN